ncbi:two-component hybrid sensor and regulator [Dictyobacter alpinus]|uniref:histidine kinase n=1 Tax=Dictyobacter alpinus TaxID=2014873 RepID=A0A402BFX8_9CHLR|nr:ATP-binding protein [Dictyobacter alpinus]GCE30321.1 two-component hybrid sensor and regulator [Dictyobacter alpinus]GCE30353.1 two-component hybrid sensor and regulator [Dictyobacter alpinus]
MPQTASFDFLAGGGDMGERIRSFDWSKTSLGPVEFWPQSLRTIIRVMLTSRQPIWIGWGSELITLYNDPYKAIMGGKHPRALGQPTSVVWQEIWHEIEPRLETALQTNEGTYDESLLLIMERYGYREETYYTFSYSPVPGDDGGVGGIICANTDDTQRIINERQLGLLRLLAASTTEARTIDEICDLSVKSLKHNLHDIPFSMLYLLDPDKQTAVLAGSSGVPADHALMPDRIALDATQDWPFAEAIKMQKECVIDKLDSLFEHLPTGAWTIPPHQAAVIPIAQSGQNGKLGALIVGLNPLRLFDEGYQGFIRLIVGQISASIANIQAYEEERKRAEALAEIDRAKTLFFSNISHEFRTPLMLMLGPVREALSGQFGLNVEQHEQMEIIHRNALRLLKLVNMLLDFSRIEAGRLQAFYTPTDLSTMTIDLASSFRSVIEKAGLKLTVDCPPLSEMVYIDQEMWEKIVLNILSNAFKYTLQGEISVTLRQHDKAVTLAVSDTGVGIPEAEIPHMFERFHRVRGTEGRTHEGTGIGLSFVLELVKFHGGSIDVKSVLGKGSTFTVTMPLGMAHLPQDHIGKAAPSTSTAVNTQTYLSEATWLFPSQDDALTVSGAMDTLSPAPDNQGAVVAEQKPGGRVLFADDNADMRAYVSRLLKQHYEVKTVPDGLAALRAVKEYRPDILLTDVMMPKMDGVELLNALRSDPETSTLPIILLSARAGEEAKIEGMQAGANDYLIKPFSARELLARVGTHLQMVRLRNTAETAVRIERERLYGLFWQAPAAIAVLEGPQHVYTLANPLYQKVFNRTEKELSGRAFRDVFPEVAGQGIYEIFDTVFATGETFVANEYPASFERTNDGISTQAYFNFVAHPIKDEDDRVENILIHAFEVTEQVRARQHLKESEERFRTLAENIPNLVWMATPDGWIYWFNSRWYTYTGTTPEQMDRDGWQCVHDPDVFPSVRKRWENSLASGEPFEMVFPLRGADTVFRPFLTRMMPICDERGSIVQWFGTSTDITEQKRLEQQKDEFIGIASHELKTPVTSLKAYTQLLERRFKHSGDTRSSELLHKMDGQLDRLTGLIKDLLDVTKIESGKLIFQNALFDLNDLIYEITEDIQRTVTRHTIMLELAEAVIVCGDRSRIGQVLINLLTNAIKYSPQSEKVIVRTTCKENDIVTSIQDFGIGIPKERHTQVFERFFRVEGENQTTYPGLGLGLYISAEFVKRHHGSIWVESEEGKGTTVSFSLPLEHADSMLAIEGRTERGRV